MIEDRNLDTTLIHAKILLEIEDAVDELMVDLDEKAKAPELRIEGIYSDRIDDVVKAYINIDRECGMERSVDDIVIEVRCRYGYPNSDEIYGLLIKKLTSMAINSLKPYVGWDKEYMFIVVLGGSDGALILEGEERNIVVPHVPGTIYACHTHPHSYLAAFSKNDVLALLDILSSRGFGSSIVSTSMCFTVYRFKPFAVEDYHKLSRIARNYEYLDYEIFNQNTFLSLRSMYSMV